MKTFPVERIMLQAKYPIIDSKEFVEIIIGEPRVDPKSANGDYFCPCIISALKYKKNFKVYGVDQIQPVWLALRLMRTEILAFEKKTKTKCQYCYFQDFEK